MQTKTALKSWMDTWTRAWHQRDSSAIAELYTPDAVYRSQPLRTPYRGRAGVMAYLRRAFREETLVRLRWGRPVIQGSLATVEYWATLTGRKKQTGRKLTFAGAVMLQFRKDGKCKRHRDYWEIGSGHKNPEPDWGFRQIGRKGSGR